MIIDTQTTGLFPRGTHYSQVTKFNNSRMIEFAYQIYDNKTLVDEYTTLIKVNVPINNSHIHGITDTSSGIDIDQLADILSVKLNGIKNIISHNIEFDISILLSELYRAQKHSVIKLFSNIDFNCTMKVNQGPTIKYVKLTDLYFQKFNETFNGKTSLNHVKACARCYYN